MKDLINPDFVFIDECETIADYIESHLYDTVHWQLPSPTSPYDPEHDEDMDRYNEMHAEAMEQVVAILATRMFNRPRRELKIINTK
jgi:hypothetical protein